ncbi:MAG: ATP-binding protein [Candidatus Methanoplasma sp.]|jgi:AAA15 family ATPase/GTPase|nr:ATP-binding protein [Candidatus Methanoplasma sp.]
MLIEYSITNYRSVREECKLSMEAYVRDKKRKEIIRTEGKIKVLPVVGIYGPNASGKTTILNSLRELQALVTGSDTLLKKKKLGPFHFRFDDVSESSPTRWKIKFTNGKHYRYDLSVKDGAVSEEILHIVGEGDVFHRIHDRVECGGSVGDDDRRKIEFIMEMTGENTLLLSKCESSNVNTVSEAYDWFDSKLMMMRSMWYEPHLEEMIDALSEYHDRIIDMLSEADFGISDVTVKKKNIPREAISDKDFKSLMRAMVKDDGEPLIAYESNVMHSIVNDGEEKEYPLNIRMESDGTKKMLFLTIQWLEAIKNGGLIVMDEFDSNLHPLLVDYLFESIADPAINTNGAQMIFTAHDAMIVKRNDMRRDQVWFTSRDPRVGTTELYSWLDYGVRPDLEFPDNYLDGRFGAIPIIRRREP